MIMPKLCSKKEKNVKTDRQRAIKTADTWFSRYIRISDKHNQINGKDIYCKCFTTGKYYHILEIQCGHFVTRGHFSTRWDFNNARPQGVYANRYKSGMPLEFESHLVEQIGIKAVESLKVKGSLPMKYNVVEIRQIAKVFRLMVRDFEKNLGCKIW